VLNILGIGSFSPDIIIDNRFIVSLGIDTSEEWIMEKIGIVTRCTTLPLDYIRETRNQDPSQAMKVAKFTPTEMAVKAAEVALQRAGIKAGDIGLVICDCCTPVELAPAEAQRIARALGLGFGVPAYDVFTACPAFALHVDFLNSFKEEKLPDYVLCVCTAALTHSVNYNDRTDGAIWGDGAAAWVVSAKHPGRLKVLYSFYSADTSRCDAVVVDRFGFFHQEGRAIRDFSVRQTVRLIRDAEGRFDLDWKRDIFIGHQANATMLQQIINNRGIPESNHWHNVETVGNQAGAGAPASLAMHWDEIAKGQKIVVAVVGAGLSWGTLVLEGT